ncbi:hypothetical protein MTR67_018585 [Solanum verrucosum]|uniref:Uncharacterized protein n=1 Tax=Solanum verrucosum TaxID=315347 RepID=A0AAF0QQ26_SOLVR|nr:hypothetical protein MTR67_018585 [Solanum verrucosum]
MTLATNNVDSEEIAIKYLYLAKVEIIKHQSELYVQNHEKIRASSTHFNDSIIGFFEHQGLLPHSQLQYHKNLRLHDVCIQSQDPNNPQENVDTSGKRIQ